MIPGGKSFGSDFVVTGRKGRQLVEWNLTNTNLKQFMLKKSTKQKHPYIIYTQALIYTDSKKEMIDTF